MSTVKGFTFFKSYWEAIKDLNEKDQNEMLKAIPKYIFEDKKPSFFGIKKTIWTLLEPTLNTSKNRSHENSGAPVGNQNARKYKGSSDIKGSEEKQPKNNQKTTKKQPMTSLSLSYSLSLSNSFNNNIIINNNNNIKELFINYLIFRENNNYNIDEVVISELLNKLDEANSDEEREAMIKEATLKGWKDFYPPKEEKKKEKFKKVSEGAYTI